MLHNRGHEEVQEWLGRFEYLHAISFCTAKNALEYVIAADVADHGSIREGKRAVELLPMTKDERDGPYNQHQLVRIYILVGEPEKALDQLESLLKIPYYLSPGWLKIDPNFDPLRKNPRFQKLVAGK